MKPIYPQVFIALQSFWVLKKRSQPMCVYPQTRGPENGTRNSDSDRPPSEAARNTEYNTIENSQSASAKMMFGLFPPSSSVTLFRLLFPAASWISLPTLQRKRIWSLLTEMQTRSQITPVNQLESLNILERLVSSKQGMHRMARWNIMSANRPTEYLFQVFGDSNRKI